MKIPTRLSLLLAAVVATSAHSAEVVQFLGQSTGPVAMNTILTATQINDAGISNPDDFACFHMDMIDPTTGSPIGTGVDCLIFNEIPGQIASGEGLANGKAFQNLAGDVAVEAVSIFSFGGFPSADLLVTQGLTSVRPLLEGFGDGGSPARTHMTGSIPDPGSNGVILATGTRSGDSGEVRVSGALTIDSNGIFFDCLWHLGL
jgi:hypothetical protein